MSIYDYGLGYGVEEMKPEQKANNNFDGDFDASSFEALNAENSLEYFDFYSKLQESNADAKIRMLRKINASLINCKSNEKLQSIEEFISTQSLETAAQSEVAGGAHEATGDKVDHEKLGEKKEGFFRELWARIVEVFHKLIDHIKHAIKWIKDKIAGLFSKTPEISEENKEKADNILKEYVIPDEDLSADGVISFKTNIADAFLGSSNKLVALCSYAKAIAGSIQKNNRAFDNTLISDHITKMIETLKNMKIPNVDKLPTIASNSKEDVKKFNSALKQTIADISFDKHPEHYVKVLCNGELIKNNKHVLLSDFFGAPKDFVAVKGIIDKTNKILDDVNKNINVADKHIDEMDKLFTQYLNAGGNRSRLTGDIKAGGNGDDSRYAVIGMVTSVFRVIQSLTGIFSKLSTKIVKSVAIATKAYNVAARDTLKAKAEKEKSDDRAKKAEDKANVKTAKENEKAAKADAKAKAEADEKAKRDAKAKADDEFFKRMEADNAKKEKEEADKKEREKNLQKVEDAKKMQKALDSDKISKATSFDNSGSQAWESWKMFIDE